MRALLGLLLAIFCWPPASSAQSNNAVQESRQAVWQWSARCGKPTMIFEVRFDNRTIHRQAVPLCRESGKRDGSRIDFTFRPKRAITWEGYRDSPDRTPSNAVLEVNLWQASGEPDAVLIGVSVMTPDRILMNTIHIVHPERRDETTIASGLVVRTYPTAANQRTASSGESVTIDVKGPLVVGFFPPFSKAEEEADDGAIREGLAHVRFAIEDIAECYKDKTAAYRLEIARSLILREAKGTRRIDIPRDRNRAVGLIFVLPGRQHRIVFADDGPSSLAILGTAAAAAYFNAPACR